MPNRSRIVTAGLATAVIAALAPAAAQAHGVAGGGAKCTLVENIPTITASANFVGFLERDKPISGKLKVDGATSTITAGASPVQRDVEQRRQDVERRAAPHHPDLLVGHPGRQQRPLRRRRDLPGADDPAAPAHPADAPDARPRPRLRPRRPRRRRPRARPRRARSRRDREQRPLRAQEARQVPHHADAEGRQAHGLVTFHLKGKGASNIRWYVDTRRAGAKRQTWEWTTGNGRPTSSTCGRSSAGAAPLGPPHGRGNSVKDSCGTARAVRVSKLYFNHDPLPNDPIFATSADQSGSSTSSSRA